MAASDELTVSDGGVDVLADPEQKPSITKAKTHGFANDSTKITEEFLGDEAGAHAYAKTHGHSIKTYFDQEYDELQTIDVVDPDMQEERPAYTFGTGASYTGQWKGRQRHGFGCQYWPDGASYKGQWRADQAYGHGRFEYQGGAASYVGEWKHNMSHGMGIAYQKDTVYMGQWADDLQSGHGVETWVADGARFEGEFSNGTKDGYGTYRWPDGSTRSGIWASGLMNGKGEFKGIDGRVVEGTWVDDHKKGFCRCQWAHGRVYEGQYDFDQKNGFGVFRAGDGTEQRCFWKSGQPVR